MGFKSAEFIEGSDSIVTLTHSLTHLEGQHSSLCLRGSKLQFTKKKTGWFGKAKREEKHPVTNYYCTGLFFLLLNDRSISTLHKCNTFACSSFSSSCNSNSSSRPRDNSRLNRKQHSSNRQLLSQYRQLLTRHNSRLSSRHSKQTPSQPSSHSLLEDR